MGKEVSREQVKMYSAYKLSDEFFPIQDSLQKAQLMLGDVTEYYFRKYNPQDEEDVLFMRYSFNRHTLLTEIAFDKVNEALKRINELEKLVNQYMELKKDGQAENEEKFLSLDVVTFN